MDPDGYITLDAAPYSSGNTAIFTITNNDSYAQSMYVQCGYGGAVTNCSTPNYVYVEGYGYATTAVTYSTGAVGAGTVNLTAYANGFIESDYGWLNVNVTDGRNAPTIDLTPYNAENRSVALCVAGCFDGGFTYTTPAYTSLDATRAVTLVYSSARVSPRVTVAIDAIDGSTTPPTKMSIRILRPDLSVVTQTNGLTETFYTGAAGRSRLAAQFDVSSLATGAYDYTVVVKSYWSDGTTRESSSAIKALVSNGDSSTPMGAGWGVSGHQHIYQMADNALVITDGDGSIARFPLQSCGSTCSYISPPGDFSVLTRRASWPDNVKWDRRYPDGTVYGYYSNGLAAYVQDRFGNRTTFLYEGSWRLAQINDPIGKTIAINYYSGYLTITDPGAPARVTTVHVNASNNLTAIQDPAGRWPFTSADYNASHQLIGWYDRRGGNWSLGYDAAGKVATSYMPSVNIDGEGWVRPTVTTGSLETAMLVFSGGTFSSPAPRINPDTLRATVTNPRGHATRYALDRFGNATRVIEPLGRETVLTRDVHSRVVSSTSPAGRTVTFSYTGPNLTSSFDYFNWQSQTIYYESTYNEDTLSINGAETVRKRWTGGKLDSIRINTNPWTKFTYDSRGRMLTQRDPGGHQTSKTYATTGLQNVRQIIAAGRSEKFGYDAYGRLVADTAPSGAVTRHQYDAINRDTLVIGPLNDTTVTTYDALYVTAVRDPKGQTYQFSPNALGWVEAHTDPALASDSARYDRSGNVTRRRSRAGRIVTFGYDALDQLQTQTADGQTTTFNVSPVGLFSVAANAESRDSVAFDVAGRPVTAVTIRGSQTYTLTASYNQFDRRTQLAISPWATSIGYKYDTQMRLDTLVDIAGGQTLIGYNTDYQASGITLPTSPSISVSLNYPAMHTPSKLIYTLGEGGQFGYRYAYVSTNAQVERRIDFTDAVQEYGRHYSYDPLNRLTGYADYVVNKAAYICSDPDVDTDPITGVDCWTHSTRVVSDTSAYAYDKVGNRSDSNAVLLPGNRLTRFRSDTMVYDADGNLVKRWPLTGGNVDSLVWNSLGQLVTVIRNGATIATFGYDGLGRRVRKTAGGATAGYLHDGDDLLVEVDASGNRVAEYTYYPGIDRPHSVRRWSGGTPSVYYFATEYPGSVIALMDQAGAIVNTYTYAPFGGQQSASGPVANSLRFAGREYDAETGLYYNRARYYDASLGRFISEDAAGLGAGINPYTYASNNPTNRWDPSGFCDDIPVKIIDDGGTTYTWWTICDEGGSSPFEQILDFAARYGVGSGAAAWNATAGRRKDPYPCQKLPGRTCLDVQNALSYLSDQPRNERCAALGQNGWHLFNMGRIEYDSKMSSYGWANPWTGTIKVGKRNWPNGVLDFSELVDTMAHEIAHVIYKASDRRIRFWPNAYRIGAECRP